MKLNNFNFKIEPSALSLRNLIQRGWDCIPSDDLLEGYFPVDKLSLEELNNKYNVEFDTLVLDCEGAFYYILLDFPNILDNIKIILIENDYLNPEHEIYMRNKLVENNFKLVYCKNIVGCWNNKSNFFEAYKKFN